MWSRRQEKAAVRGGPGQLWWWAAGGIWKIVVGKRSGRLAVLTGGRSRGAESTKAAAGEANEVAPAVEGGRVEEELEEPVDDEAEVCCGGARRAESGIIRSRGLLACLLA